MKILCVSQRFFPAIGGAERVMEYLMDYLSKRHEITVYTSNALNLDYFWDSTSDSVNVSSDKNYPITRYAILQPSKIPKDLYAFPFSIGSPGPFCPEMWHDLLNLDVKPDLIIASAFPYDHIIPAIIASKKHKIPIILIPHIHLEFPELYLTGLRLALLAESAAIVVNTKSEKRALMDYNFSESKIHIIPPGIGISMKKNSDAHHDFRKQFGISNASIVILFVGQKSAAKGTMYLIESLKTLWRKTSKLELVLIGQSTKEFENYLRKQDREYLRHIHDLGISSEELKLAAFSSCDIFALPSKSESFGIGYLEAWLNKKPIIGCNIKAVSDLIETNKDGLLVEFGNITELSDALEKLLVAQTRTKFGENGFKKLVENYDLEKLCGQFENLCLSLCQN